MLNAGQLLESRVDNSVEFQRHELQSHRLLYEIIRQRDPERARKAMIEHIEYTEGLILEAFRAGDVLDLATDPIE
jgi:DNA-binding GntR family transcriptional regulator